jgi:hypothetical protein
MKHHQLTEETAESRSAFRGMLPLLFFNLRKRDDIVRTHAFSAAKTEFLDHAESYDS